MKINLKTKVCDFEGKEAPLVGDKADIGTWLVAALNSVARQEQEPGSRPPDIKEIVSRAELTFTIQSALTNGGECELTAEHVTMLKTRVAMIFWPTPIVVKQIHLLLEGKEMLRVTPAEEATREAAE